MKMLVRQAMEEGAFGCWFISYLSACFFCKDRGVDRIVAKKRPNMAVHILAIYVVKEINFMKQFEELNPHC
jgi:hypothetical protein